MPLLKQPVLRPFAGHRQSVQLPREADGEVAHVDHFLDFAFALRAALAHLERDEQTEIGFVGSQPLADRADQLAPLRRGDRPPPDKGFLRGGHDRLVFAARCRADARQRLARRRVERNQLGPRRFDPSAARLDAGQDVPRSGRGRDHPQTLENRFVHGSRPCEAVDL